MTKYTPALMPVALFGITNSGLSLFVNLLILFLVVVWIALIAWTYLDARRRIADPVLVACATAASLFPYVGTIVYAILRPPEFLDDTRERELEIRASQLRVRQLEEQSCPNCGYPIERTYLRCPSCRVRVKDPCSSCGKPIDPRWTLCPYCEAPVRRAERGEAPARRSPRERVAPRAAGERASGTRAPGPRPASAAQRSRKASDRPARQASSDSEPASAPRPSRPASSRSAPPDRSPSRSGGPNAARSTRREGSEGRPAPASES